MENSNRTSVTVQATVNKPIQDVWAFWNEPEHITQWCQASDDWHAPFAENDLQTGGRFKTTMAAKDGSYSFDFSGAYTEVQPMKKLPTVSMMTGLYLLFLKRTEMRQRLKKLSKLSLPIL
jgi:uncharacterized protein YndB with AHSA1/START domain